MKKHAQTRWALIRAGLIDTNYIGTKRVTVMAAVLKDYAYHFDPTKDAEVRRLWHGFIRMWPDQSIKRIELRVIA